MVHAAVAGRAISVPNDPITAGGFFAYSYGTRALRELFLSKGWLADGQDNIASVVHPETGVKIIFQSTDTAGDALREPKAVSGKGVASERIVELAQKNLFKEMDEEDKHKVNSTVWFLCVYQKGQDVRAELSRPLAVEGGQFNGFIERIFIVQYGEWKSPDTAAFENIGIPPGPEFEIDVSKKSNK